MVAFDSFRSNAPRTDTKQIEGLLQFYFVCERLEFMKILIQITAVVTLFVFAGVIARAECNCGTNAVMSTGYGVPVVPLVGAAPFGAMNYMNADYAFGSFNNHMRIHEPHPLQADGRRYPISPTNTGAFSGVSLVPQVAGTLGHTYQRRTHAIPEDKHPRLGMLAVRDKGAFNHLSVQRMSGFRMKEDVWLYETDKPMTSWTENIVRIEARHEPEDVEPYKTMFVRLIPGRLVYLDFH